MSLAEPEDRNPYQTVGMLCVLRYERNHSDEQIAEKLGFDSIEDMRFQLESWKLPGWLIGEAFGPEGKTAQNQDSKRRTGKRKAKTVRGPAQELPPSKEAASLFKEALDKLRYDLEALVYLQSGARRTPEYIQDGRFIQDTREEAPRWAPDLGGRTRVTGVTQAPRNGLTELIAAYLVAGGDPELLIEKLHYNPDTPRA